MSNMNPEDVRFVEPELLELFQSNLIDMHKQFGEHLGLPVITHTDGAWIDAYIAELVFYMWRAGIRTTESCQDLYHDGAKAYIGFAEPQDLQLFLGLAVPEDGIAGSLWDRATGCNEGPDTPNLDMWEYKLMPYITGRRVRFRTYVEFPPKDVTELVRRLKAFDKES
jgi:hypothetical protein